MQDKVYCYPDSDVLINKLNITDRNDLFQAEKEITIIRLQELQENPVKGKFDFEHLLKIHKYIFQDIYEWAGKIRTVEIGKGNLFCTTPCIQSYAKTVFDKYYKQCYKNKDDRNEFIKVLAENYGDLNALHPFREGNGRAQREFARLVCLSCGYVFDLSTTVHEKMLAASQLSFNKYDNSLFCEIFEKAVIPVDLYIAKDNTVLRILTSDDLTIDLEDNHYDYYSDTNDNIIQYNEFYQEKISEMKNKEE